MRKYEICWSKGVGFRSTPHFDDKNGRTAAHGQVVVGHVEGDWFVEAGTDQYLPLRAPNRKMLLRPVWEDIVTEECAAPTQSFPSAAKQMSNELELLHKKGDSKFGRPKHAHGGRWNELDASHQMSNQKCGQPRGTAALSHEVNERYMSEFEEALQEQGVNTSMDPYLHPERRARRGVVPKGEPISTKPFRLLRPMTEQPRNALVQAKEWKSVKHGREVTNVCSSGRVTDLSDRNLLCMAILEEKAVFGSADHGLKEVNIASGTVVRTLYTKRFGHTDWVATVDYATSGKILSGGTDGKLCLWNPTGAAGVYLSGHTGSIARVRCHGSKVGCSASYDKTLRLWDLERKREITTLMGHSAPVLEFVWPESGGWIGSGDRGGTCKLWDLQEGVPMADLKGHKGHVTALCVGQETELLSGAQDGHVRLWDTRERLNTHNLGVHTGAVNEICCADNLLVTAGADCRVVCLDRRQTFQPIWEATTADFIYSMIVQGCVLTGDGRGNVVCRDFAGNEKYSLEAGQNAVRCLGASPTCLVCGGDDGNAFFFDF